MNKILIVFFIIIFNLNPIFAQDHLKESRRKLRRSPAVGDRAPIKKVPTHDLYKKTIRGTFKRLKTKIKLV